MNAQSPLNAHTEKPFPTVPRLDKEAWKKLFYCKKQNLPALVLLQGLLEKAASPGRMFIKSETATMETKSTVCSDDTHCVWCCGFGVTTRLQLSTRSAWNTARLQLK